MTDENENTVEELADKVEEIPKEITPKKSKNLAIGIDVGTMNLVCARGDSSQIKTVRNVFLKINEDDISVSELSDISFVKSDDGELFIVGEDAFRFGNIFGQQVSRPMERGLISPKEISAIDVLSLIIKNLIGSVKNVDAYCSYSIPAAAIDEDRSVTYHERVFGRILTSLGVNHTPVNEGMAIIYSECQKEKFSGVGISFGAGMVNVCLAYKGIEVLKFSTARSGDWVDKSVGDSLGIVPNRITSLKEKNLDFTTGYTKIKNKKTRRVIEALEYYYSALIDYTIKQLCNEFDDKVDIEIDESLPIIISGGTSKPQGFLNLFQEGLKRRDLPFDVSEVRQAKDPLTCVARGLLIKTQADIS